MWVISVLTNLQSVLQRVRPVVVPGLKEILKPGLPAELAFLTCCCWAQKYW